MTTTHYVSPSGIEVYSFDDDENLVTITGNPPKSYTSIEFDNAYDFEEYVKSHIDDGVEFDSEYSQFFAYTHTPETAIEFVKKIEDWFDKIRK